MNKIYNQWVDLRPSWRKAVALIGVSVGIILLAYYTNEVTSAALIIAVVVIIVTLAYLVPQLLSWYASILIQHYAAIREARTYTEANANLILAKQALEQYDQILRQIKHLDDDQLKAALAIPMPAEMDLLPAGIDFLNVPGHGRIDMSIVRHVAEKWIERTAEGGSVMMLPPVRLWSGRTRELVKALYQGMAEAGLIIVRSEQGDPWAGNTTATVSQFHSPIDVLRYMRVDGEYILGEPNGNRGRTA